MIIPVVLAGGVGTRLWPVSRQLYPKQFTSLSSDPTRDAPDSVPKTLFQTTLSRLEGVRDLGAPIVVCNEEHRFLTAQQLQELGIGGASIVLEPIGRNTAPAVAIAALQAMQMQPNAILLVLPADHAIRDTQALCHAIEVGEGLAARGKLVTFGIVPTAAETGYGYILRGVAEVSEAYAVQRFVEKPDLATAKTYVDSGDYYWNSGMFMFTAERFLAELAQHAPDIMEVCRKAFAGIQPDVDFMRLPKELFAVCRSDSIDYAVMEKTRDAVVVPLDAQWNDLGAWNSLWETSGKDSAQNVLSGDVFCEDVKGSYIRAESRLVAAVGIEDLIIIETADAILVSARDRVQDVKRIVQQLEKAGRAESVNHVLVYRPWGSYESLAMGTGYQVKHIMVKPGASLSLQLHHHRAEHWIVVKGSATVTCDERVFTIHENESTFIPLGSKHRLQNHTTEMVELIEVQTGNYLGEDDIVRFDDIYGRAPVNTH
ncbi:MAG: mannose-1-phosphate guanylyltransferase/mannose-6-phosphate isomerase [Gammaproteobacteria bacterium]|nr:mannose-1-phosphate guanylyltransferase/mannose-6-phosphate isomerase [Gammaproteobacteria bacterium]MDP2142409.1 mannose-1-phosphate guanylyltransferase/mannose-6-phosphate isomerase [Gammaproteobacteria bacterium]MDP2348650.1 mannose-1-phosphate guanylyltransferase/mannose-6-phosphate isomerase [Gammaproteobacteria bacterium]